VVTRSAKSSTSHNLSKGTLFFWEKKEEKKKTRRKDTGVVRIRELPNRDIGEFILLWEWSTSMQVHLRVYWLMMYNSILACRGFPSYVLCRAPVLTPNVKEFAQIPHSRSTPHKFPRTNPFARAQRAWTPGKFHIHTHAAPLPCVLSAKVPAVCLPTLSRPPFGMLPPLYSVLFFKNTLEPPTSYCPIILRGKIFRWLESPHVMSPTGLSPRHTTRECF